MTNKSKMHVCLDGTEERWLNGEPMPVALRVFWELQRKSQ